MKLPEVPHVPMSETEPPPFLGRWSRVYAVVVLYLVLNITLMYAFTVSFPR